MFTVEYLCTCSFDPLWSSQPYLPGITAHTKGSLQRIDPTLNQLHRYPLRLGGPRQCGNWEALPNTSTHDSSVIRSHTFRQRTTVRFCTASQGLSTRAAVCRVAPPICGVQYLVLCCWRESNPGRQHKSQGRYPYSTELQCKCAALKWISFLNKYQHQI